MSLRVALVVDNPYRDLPGLVLLSSRLAARGVRCHLVPMNTQDVELRALAPDAVVVNYARPSNERLLRRLLDADVAVIVLDTEGGVLASLDAYEKTLVRDAAVRKGIAAYCSWGPVLGERAVDAGWFSARQVVVTGAPRFDFYHPEWQQASLAASPWATEVGPPVVLVNGNFPVVNPRFQSASAEARMLVEKFGWDAGRVEEWQRTQRLTLEGLVGLVNRAATELPDINFVYRPHPFERADIYESLLDKRENVHLVKRGSVDGWILRSSAVVQRSCTTAIEAALAGKPPLSPIWVPTSVEMEAAERVSLACSTFDELRGHLVEAAQGTLRLPEASLKALDTTVADWFLAVDGRAHERVADVVLDRCRPHERMGHVRRCRNLDLGGRDLRSRAVVAAKRALPSVVRSLATAQSRAASVEKRFSVAEVRNIAAALDKARRRPAPVTVSPADTDYAYRLPFGRAVTIAAGDG